jgi:hypothetical protein
LEGFIHCIGTIIEEEEGRVHLGFLANLSDILYVAPPESPHKMVSHEDSRNSELDYAAENSLLQNNLVSKMHKMLSHEDSRNSEPDYVAESNLSQQSLSQYHSCPNVSDLDDTGGDNLSDLGGTSPAAVEGEQAGNTIPQTNSVLEHYQLSSQDAFADYMAAKDATSSSATATRERRPSPSLGRPPRHVVSPSTAMPSDFSSPSKGIVASPLRLAGVTIPALNLTKTATNPLRAEPAHRISKSPLTSPRSEASSPSLRRDSNSISRRGSLLPVLSPRDKVRPSHPPL